jgi:cell division protein FtsQ
LRSGNLFSTGGSTVLDAPERDRAQMGAKTAGFKRGAAVTEMPLRRDSLYPNDYAGDYGDDSGPEFARRRRGVRLSFHGGLIPRTLWGRLAAGAALLLLAGGAIAAAFWANSFLLHDAHFVVPDSESIQIAGNSHLTRAQVLSVFGEDVGRNIFLIPLDQRRAELESLPWVEHATVMRLLPNRVRVAILERTPVAFVRQGSQVGLVDANGVLFDLPGPESDPSEQRPLAGDPVEDGNGTAAAARKAQHYSFPVLTGISAGDPLSTRAARMRIYLDFMAALDATGEAISHKVSEVDVSNPEDVRAILPDAGAGSGGADILVHFGDGKYLERYHQYQAHLAEWRTQYPKLASVDMRYERQVVLEMQPGTAVPNGDAAPTGAAPQAAPAAGLDGAARGGTAAKPGGAAAQRRAMKKNPAASINKLKGKPAGAASPGMPR